MPKTKTKKASASKSKKTKIWVKNVQTMKKKLETSLTKLKKDIKNKASFEQIEEDNNELLMLLGECNYVVREFHEHTLEK